MRNSLIVFAKTPVMGNVKTRIARDSSPGFALKIHQELLSKTLKVASQVGAQRFLYSSDGSRLMDSDLFVPRIQKGRDLGEKMLDAFSEVLSASEKAVIIGSDCYDLKSEIILNAFDFLNEVDVVIGPALDGGYYLLGMKKVHQYFFSNISWGSEKVFEETMALIKENNLSFIVLSALKDVDFIEDIPQDLMRKTHDFSNHSHIE